MNRLARHIVLLIAWVLAALPVAAQPLVLHGNVTYQPEYYSLHPHAQIVEDAEHRLGLEDVITPSDSLEQAFMPLETEVTNLDFTSSSYWVRFDVANASAQELNLILEVARPLTNRADLYVRGENGKRLLIRHGDALPFHNRQIKDPRLLFPLRLAPGITYHYYLHLESDGEIINLPLRLWQEDALLTTTTKQHYFFGVYYGTQLLVFLLFLFFYLSIRERSFLLYTIYVLALMLLQLGLDGLAYQLLWPKAVWWGNHAIVIFASVAVISLLQYVSAFMQLSKILPRFYKVFNGFTLLGLACLLFSFASGTLYALVFPTVNLLSFAVVLLVLITLFYATSRGHKADPLFVIAFGFSMVSAIVFILQNVNVITANVFTVHALKFGTALEVILLSLSMTGRYRDIQREKEKAQAIALRQLEELNQLKDEQNSILEQQVAERTEEIAEKNAELEQKNKDITDSIRYAKRIQEAILPPDRLVKGQLKDCFVLYIPKDIVAGDFYWLETQGDWIIFAAADCTGHGVPGAMVSVVCHNALNRAVREFGISEPAKVLDTVSILVEETFAKSEQEVKDGMDIALCALNPATGAVQYAGAHNPLWIITTRELEGLPEPYQPEGSTHRLYEIKPDKMPIGHYHQRKPFINHRLQLQPGDTIYLFSDGFPDQFGGPRGKKYKYRALKNFVLGVQNQGMESQREALFTEFHDWRGPQEQVDDVCIIGVRMGK